jgi:hypothetical protein
MAHGAQIVLAQCPGVAPDHAVTVAGFVTGGMGGVGLVRGERRRGAPGIVFPLSPCLWFLDGHGHG